MQCSKCGFQNSPGATYCLRCGEPLLAPSPAPAQPGQVCPNCGTPNAYNAQFCVGCGAQLNIIPVTSAPVAEKKPRTWLWFFVVAGIVICFLVLAGLVLLYIFGPENITISLWDQPAQPVMIEETVIVQSGPDSDSSKPPQPQQPPPQPVPPRATDTPLPEPPTQRPPVTSTNTPAYPVFEAGQNSLCRAGPSQAYEVKTSLYQGDKVRIYGKSGPDWQDWWYVDVKGARCWVWSGLGTTSGDLSGIRVVEPPPVPNVRLRISNGMDPARTEGTICSARLYSPAQGQGQGYLVIEPNNVLAPGNSRAFTVPTGDYTVSICLQGPGGCCTGVYNGKTLLEYQNCSVRVP